MVVLLAANIPKFPLFRSTGVETLVGGQYSGCQRVGPDIRVESELCHQKANSAEDFRSGGCDELLDHCRPKFSNCRCLDDCPRRARLMSGTKKPKCRNVVLCGIVLGLVLALGACGTDFKKDFLCRPAGHCVDAADGGTGSN